MLVPRSELVNYLDSWRGQWLGHKALDHNGAVDGLCGNETHLWCLLESVGRTHGVGMGWPVLPLTFPPWLSHLSLALFYHENSIVIHNIGLYRGFSKEAWWFIQASLNQTEVVRLPANYLGGSGTFCTNDFSYCGSGLKVIWSNDIRPENTWFTVLKMY